MSSLRGEQAWPIPAPKGGHVVFFSNTMGSYQLWIGKLRKGRLVGTRILAKGLRYRSAWSSKGLRWTSKGKSFYLLHKGQVVKIAVPSGKVRRISLQTTIEIDRQASYEQKFREVWRTLRDHFYDPKMSGQDWKALYNRYLPAIKQVQTKEEWRDLMNEMLGWLNASHLGVRTRRRKAAYRTGVLGVDLQIEGKRVKVTRLLERGPLSLAIRLWLLKQQKRKKQSKKTKAFATFIKQPTSYRLYISKISRKKIRSGSNFYPLLRNKVGKRVRVKLSLEWDVSTKDKQGKKIQKKQIRKTFYVKPTHRWAEVTLRYHAWVAERKRLVTKWSRGRIGYLHMRGMGRSNLYKFISDFETDVAPKKASLIDLRFNWGGNVHDSVLRYLSRRRYSYWQPRGMKRWSQPFHTAAGKPMAMLINERSLSDAEMTANGFKALRLGKLIGVGTYRWLIFTGSRRLFDGDSYRLPFWSCTTLQGKDLEKIGVPSDLYVRNTFADRLHNRDPQLKKAVQHLLKQLKK